MADAGADQFTFHIETSDQPKDLCRKVENLNRAKGYGNCSYPRVFVVNYLFVDQGERDEGGGGDEAQDSCFRSAGLDGPRPRRYGSGQLINLISHLGNVLNCSYGDASGRREPSTSDFPPTE